MARPVTQSDIDDLVVVAMEWKRRAEAANTEADALKAQLRKAVGETKRLREELRVAKNGHASEKRAREDAEACRWLLE